MKKLYCVIRRVCRKFEKPEIPYLLVFFIIWSKCKNKDEILFKEEQSIEIIEFLSLIENI